jgi:IS30 family transposase
MQHDRVFVLIGGWMTRSKRRGRYRLLTPTVRLAVERRFRQGAEIRQVMWEFDLAYSSAKRIRDDGLLTRWRVLDSAHRLSFEDRERIFVGISRGESDAEIARALGRHRSTVGREIRRCGGRRHYRPLRAERSARRLACRPKETKLSRSPRLVMVVEAGLEKRHSPQQISARLKVEHPEDPEMRISHETIYLSLYVQSRGELRRQLAARLRSGRTRRRPHGRLPQPDWITGRVSISERPPEVQDRAVPGHWEGDLIVGAANRSFIVTLVERQTRYVMLARLGREHDSERVIEALKGQVGQLPSRLARSLTWDQGAELRLHERFSRQSGMQVYFCDPRSPWQRGSNENTNGLLRQYLPKGSDLAVHSQTDLDAIAAELNERPRRTLGWMTPAERMAELLGGVSPTA